MGRNEFASTLEDVLGTPFKLLCTPPSFLALSLRRLTKLAQSKEVVGVTWQSTESLVSSPYNSIENAADQVHGTLERRIGDAETGKREILHRVAPRAKPIELESFVFPGNSVFWLLNYCIIAYVVFPRGHSLF